VASLRTFPTLPTHDANGVERGCDAIGVEDPVTGAFEGDAADPREPVWLRAPDGRRISIVWPAGFTVRFTPAARLLNEHQEPVAAGGDNVTLQVPRAAASGTFEDPYYATGILLGGCYHRATAIEPGGIAITIAERIRVRSAPVIDDASAMYEPLLPRGTALFVLDGPVAASGYDWYQVVPISVRLRGAEYGWVARASRDGDAWLAPGSAACPASPGTLEALRILEPGIRLACFAGQPITVQARLIQFDGDVDGPTRLEPAWFNDGPGYPPHLLLDPTDPQGDPATAWFGLHLDPAGSAPDPLPIGRVMVTGLFDHPAARACQLTTYDPTTTTRPDPSCRWQFAVTSLAAAPP
jgi:hypothetical protein